MVNSEFAKAVDDIQRALSPVLHPRGFVLRGRAFRRTTGEGLVHVVGFQMGASEPPGTTAIPGLRESLRGRFTVELGVFVPEVERCLGRSESRWPTAAHCAIRARLAQLDGQSQDGWWPACAEAAMIDDVRRRLESDGLAFLERRATRDDIVAEVEADALAPSFGSPPRIVAAVIHAERGEHRRAREQLALQVRKARDERQAAHVCALAVRLGLAPLDS